MADSWLPDSHTHPDSYPDLPTLTSTHAHTLTLIPTHSDIFSLCGTEGAILCQGQRERWQLNVKCARLNGFGHQCRAGAVWAEGRVCDWTQEPSSVVQLIPRALGLTLFNHKAGIF